MKQARKDARILVATEVASDAALVKKLLHDDFEQVFVSTAPDLAIADFERHKPDVLVLAFDNLEKSERYYLDLYRHSTMVHTLPHRTLILCNKEQLLRAFGLCKKGSFDDYILFWPQTHDTARLPMALHHALRDLDRAKGDAPAAEMVQQARRIAELEQLLEHNLLKGSHRVKTANRFLEQAETEIGAALDGFSQKLSKDELADTPLEGDATRLRQEIGKLKADGVEQRFRALNSAVLPMTQWVGEMKQQLVPHLESARALKALVEKVRPRVMMVDDDEFQHKLVEKILRAEPYELVFAASGLEALGLLRKERPNLILMDMVMPEIDGLETLRRLKSATQSANIPVMMITGQSDKEVVMECLKAGAADFVVKPFDKDVLLKKVARFLAG